MSDDQSYQDPNAQAQPDTDWPFPAFPKGKQRNFFRRADEPYTGWEGDFLDALTRTGVQRAACQHAKVSYFTVQHRRRYDREFLDACNLAMELALDLASAALWQRAVQGQKRTEIQEELIPNGEGGHIVKSRKIKEITEYSDDLLKFLLKSLRPAVFRDQVDVTHRHQVLRAEAERVALQEGLDVEELMAELHSMGEGR